jgi:hypothetical protein
MEQFILSSLNKEANKLPVPHLRFPDAQDGHNFTLSSGLLAKGAHEDAENVDPSGAARKLYGFTHVNDF